MAEIHNEQDLEIGLGEIDLGPCCACGKSGPTVRNLICLDTKAPVPGTGWGCVVCGLSSDGAMAVVCDGCLEDGTSITQAIVGYPKGGGRIAQDKLSGRHEHDERVDHNVF